MEFNGVAYSRSRLHRLACAADGMAGDTSDAHARFEASSGAARAALGDDDYGRMYWQARGQRMESIGTGLELLATALREQETRIHRASQTYEACEDATTLRT
ncbi:hypothetical protein [Nonomuraea basaltis]|uniref:hypothetical protein n=1 Tax=Nonomuraea basaltis TaxID=2495887 RepID=UPI00110C5F6C|nr:hypothetical protein [Nonomuraea basaltis]TMR99927.1 hypothetical protein EJK15_05335 [Nonomuraea basaltis]